MFYLIYQKCTLQNGLTCLSKGYISAHIRITLSNIMAKDWTWKLALYDWRGVGYNLLPEHPRTAMCWGKISCA